MYNYQNLPLEKKKIIKKSFSSIVGSALLSLFAALMIWLVLYSMDKNTSGILFAFLAFIVINLIFGGSVILYQYLYYKFYYYNFGDDSAEIKKGVISNATGHVRYSRIQNIYVDQDILDRIFGLYDVHYETAGESSGFYSHVDGLNKENSDKLVAFLNDRVMNKDPNNTQNIETKNTNSENNKSNEGANDERVFTRENLPIEKRLVFSIALTGSLALGFFILLFFGRMAVAMSEIMSSTAIIMTAVMIYLIVIFGNYIYAKIWFKNFYFKFENKNGLIIEKVLAVKNTYLYYDRIQNIDISQSIIARLLGLNNLKIETAAEGSGKISAMQIPGLSKANAEKLKDFLLEKTQKYRTL